MKRLVLLSLWLSLLIAGLPFLRSYRFERVPGIPNQGIAEIKKLAPQLPEGALWMGSPDRPRLLVQAVEGQRSVSLRIDPGHNRPMDALYIRANIEAKGLVRGKNEWDEGRLLIQWLSASGRDACEVDAVTSVRDNERSGEIGVIARPANGSGFPVIRIEHLGSEGEFRINELELVPVHQRPGWEWARWSFVAACIGWLFVFLMGQPKTSLLARLATVAIWISMAILFAFPGPWKTLVPFVKPFELGIPAEFLEADSLERKPEPVIAEENAQPPLPLETQSVPGKILPSEAWIIKTKNQLKDLRVFTHVVFYFLPAMTFVYLVGKRRGTLLFAGLVALIEGSQVAFGFGFDFLDILDLLCAAVAILLARHFLGKFRIPGSCQEEG